MDPAALRQLRQASGAPTLVAHGTPARGTPRINGEGAWRSVSFVAGEIVAREEPEQAVTSGPTVVLGGFT